MVPLITRETSFGQYVSEMVFENNIFDVDLSFEIDSVEQIIKRYSVGSGHVSHCWTSSFDYHFEDSFIVSKNVQTEIHCEKNVCWWVRSPNLTIDQHLKGFFQLSCWSWILLEWFLFRFPGTSLIVFQLTSFRDWERSPVSNEMISDSVELWNRRLLLTYLTNGNEYSTFKDI